jgi:hypothetical protein
MFPVQPRSQIGMCTYVLSHKDNSLAEKRLTDLLQVVRANVIGLNNENLGVLLGKLDNAVKVLLLLLHFILYDLSPENASKKNLFDEVRKLLECIVKGWKVEM